MSGADDALALFERWYEQEADQLYRFIWVRVRNTSLAEELMATACEEALTHINRYDPQRGSMRAWLYGITRNVLRTAYRRAAPEPLPLDALDRVAEPTARPVEEVAQRREAIAAVLEHMDVLLPDEQEIVALRFGAGLSNTAIAEVTGLSANYVGVKLHRAIRKLRDALNLALALKETHP